NMKTRNSNFTEKAIRQITVEYEYLKNGKAFDTETTGIEDNAERIHIHPPRDSYFDVSEVVHFPFITKPIGLGFKTSTEIVIQKVKAPPKTEVFVNIVSNNSINSGRNEKIKIHRKADYQDSRRTRTRHPKPYRLPTLVI
ncbi:MAG: hypothetical protein ACK52I_26480, partial [Pseudomonadota bacterium]